MPLPVLEVGVLDPAMDLLPIRSYRELQACIVQCADEVCNIFGQRILTE